MLGPALSNMQKVDNLATHVILLTTLTTLFKNVGPFVLQKGSGEGVNYLQISYVLMKEFFSTHSLHHILLY